MIHIIPSSHYYRVGGSTSPIGVVMDTNPSCGPYPSAATVTAMGPPKVWGAYMWDPSQGMEILVEVA